MLKVTGILSLSVVFSLPPSTGSADDSDRRTFSPGAAGIGDPYFPLAGNGGYDVEDYHLAVEYDPATDQLVGEARITARATQNLSSINLDFVGLTIDGISFDHCGATWARDGGELTVTPARGIRKHSRFVTVVRYHGVPETIFDDFLGTSGYVHTDDGALVIGEPAVAATWFPVNDHPRDVATYTLDITGPADLEVIANGHLVEQRTRHGWTTWRWAAREPMASYLVGWTMGKYAVNSYRENGLRFVNAIDVDLYIPPVTPVSGEALAVSGQANLSYKRMTRELTVPASGGVLSFHVNRDTEAFFDFFFVEARVAGSDVWTTLPDLDGFATQDVGACALPFFHPFIFNYLTPIDVPPFCVPSGATGSWWAAHGASEGWEPWQIDLSAYAGQVVEISLAYASDDIIQGFGVAIDDIAFTTGEGTTTFENGDTGGWEVPGAPPDGSVNSNDWFVGGQVDLPPAPGEVAQATLERGGEIIAFLESFYGDYPFRDAGGIVHAVPEIHFALENQTRPIYSGSSFGPNSGGGIYLVVHEVAHQWYGDQVHLDSWQHIWLNEGFATYAEWLWSEVVDGFSADLIFDNFYAIPPQSSFWRTIVGDPTPQRLFSSPIYNRGAMTLHQLRRTVGDDDFFKILRRWGSRERSATTADFIALAERISGQELDELFAAWLFTGTKPTLVAPPTTTSLRAAAPSADVAARVKEFIRITSRSHR